MRTLAILILSFLLVQPVLAEKAKKRQVPELTAYKLHQLFDKDNAKRLSPKIRNVVLKNFYVTKKIMHFEFQGVKMHFEAIGKLDKFIRFNGRDFSIKDFRSRKALDLAFRSRFGIETKKSRFSWENLHKGRVAAFDGTDVTQEDFYAAQEYQAMMDQQQGETAVGDGVNFEDMEVKKYSYGGRRPINTEDTPMLAQTEWGENFALQADVRTEMMRAGVNGGTMMAVETMAMLALAMQAMEPSYQVIFGKGAGVGDVEAVGDIPAPHQTRSL